MNNSEFITKEQFWSIMERVFREVDTVGYKIEGISILFKVTNDKDTGYLSSRTRINPQEYIGMLTTELDKIKSDCLMKATQNDMMEAFSKIKAIFEKEEYVQH